MTNDGVADTGCPLKVMHTDAAKNAAFQWHAPFYAGIDSTAKRKSQANSRTPLSPHGRKIQISFMEQADRAFYRLFCLSMDERTIY